MISSLKRFQHIYTYFYKILGIQLIGFIFINLLVGIFDGLGLSLFIPLIGYASNGNYSNQNSSIYIYINQMFESLNLELNLYTLLLSIVVIFGIKALFSYIREILANRLKLKLNLKVKSGLLDDLDTLSYIGFSTISSGEIQNVHILESQRVFGTLNNFIHVLQNTAIVLAYLCITLYTNWQFSLLVILAGIATRYLYTYLNNLIKKEALKLTDKSSIFNDLLLQSIQNFKYLKATGYHHNYYDVIRSKLKSLEVTQYKISKQLAIGNIIKEPIVILIIVSIIFIYLLFVDQQLNGIILSLLLFYRGLNYLINIYVHWNHVTTNAHGIDTLQNMQRKITQFAESPYSSDKKFSFKILKLENVSLYLNQQLILKNISLEIPPKSVTAFVGKSGSGKTSLINLICGLYQPTSGNVLLDRTIRDESLSIRLRKKIGYITQEPVVFSDTLFNNITFWSERNDKNITKYKKAIEIAGLKDFSEAFPQKENTLLGPKGVQLSGGQKQRVSIAREIFKECQILIFDEATSSLDSETEKTIQKNLETLHGKITIIIIAHRLSTIVNTDMIYLLEDGEIIDNGEFIELYQKNKQFKDMVTYQKL